MELKVGPCNLLYVLKTAMKMIRWMCIVDCRLVKNWESLYDLKLWAELVWTWAELVWTWAELVWTCAEEKIEKWVNNCMRIRVEGRKPVGRPRETWLENVEADMAELEIDKEDIHDRKKCYEQEVKLYRKTDNE